MRYGTKVGILVLGLGAFLLFLNAILMWSGKYSRNLIILGCGFVGFGLGFILFKGGEAPKELSIREKGNYHSKNAPLLSKIMWWLFFFVGIAIGIYWIFAVLKSA